MQRGHPSQPVGFGLKGLVLDNGNSVVKGVGDSAGALLDNVREFVAEKELAVRGVRVVLARREVQIGAPGKGDGANRGSLGTYVDPDVGEVCAERGFHLGLNIARQRPSAGFWTKVDLKGVNSGTGLAYRLSLDCA